LSDSIRRELYLPHPPEAVWRALTDRAAMADWLLPNDFEPRVGHRFIVRSQPRPHAGLDGLIHCEVLACDAPARLVYSWSAAGVDTRVSYRLEADGGGTRLFFEQSGFDFSQPRGESARKGAEHVWNRMLGALERAVERVSLQG
jgi:uncharacterized protein YndB with AHSA1/START domain